jgi:hypothetical protein
MSLSEEEERDAAAARASFARGEGIPHEEVLREFGLTMDDWERMGRTPLDVPFVPGQQLCRSRSFGMIAPKPTFAQSTKRPRFAFCALWPITHLPKRAMSSAFRGFDPPELRLRVGDYRVRFRDLKDSVRILTVQHRREAYR